MLSMIYNKFDNFEHWYNNFQYWFAHWCAFNMTAMNLGVWKFHHLFHDFEKPWLSLFVKYEKLHKYHITHANHHIEHYRLTNNCNWLDLVIDWEASQFTKEKGKLTAREYLDKMINEHLVSENEVIKIKCILDKYDL